MIVNPADMQTISISNTSKLSTHYQIYVVSLIHKEGKDIEKPVKDFLIFPQILKLKAGETKKVQLKYLIENDEIYEKNFRLVLKQINTIESKDHVKILFDFKIPIYISPKTHINPKPPVCEITDHLNIDCFNPNPEHITLTNIREKNTNRKRSIIILANSKKKILIPSEIKNPILDFFYVDNLIAVTNIK